MASKQHGRSWSCWGWDTPHRTHPRIQVCLHSKMLPIDIFCFDVLAFVLSSVIVSQTWSQDESWRQDYKERLYVPRRQRMAGEGYWRYSRANKRKLWNSFLWEWWMDQAIRQETVSLTCKLRIDGRGKSRLFALFIWSAVYVSCNWYCVSCMTWLLIFICHWTIDVSPLIPVKSFLLSFFLSQTL